MQCPQCQFENRVGASFCLECGNALEFECPDCQRLLPPSAKFCDGCGHDVGEPKEAPPIDYTAPQSYTPKHLADKILTTRSSIEGEHKLVTVLFADVADYTAMSEKLDPEEVHQIMDGCFKILIDEIHKYEGTINQFTGDGVMALFGAPVAHEDHARRACQAALAIQKAMKEYGAKIEKETGKEFKMRIGINSGPVIVGAIGDDLRMDYTAVGDTTNLAARMESLARPGTVMLTGDAHKLVRDYFEFESYGRVEVKGKEDPQDAWQLLRPSDIGSRFEASVAKGLTKFVGRKKSLAALMEPYEKVREGAGQVVGIVGEAGVGKSRLLLEFRTRIEDGFTYLEGRCIQFGGTMAFLPLLDILRKYCGIEEGEREYLVKKKLSVNILELDDQLKWTLAPFQDLLSVQVDDEAWTNLEPKEKREKTFEALRDLLIRLSQERLLILTIEDLHWMDKSSEEFLGYFIDWMAGSRILLLLLYRPEYSHQWGSKTYYNRIGLDQLTTKSSAELVQVVLGRGEIVPELSELILGRAAGNPLFMEELTHTLLENGSIEKQDDRFVLSRKPSDIQVPDTIQGIIAARMDRLEDNIKRTMQVASVIGRDFAFRILQSIPYMREDLKTCLLNLQGLEFIYEKQLFPELEYIFKHALTQEVAYNSLLHKRRKEIHENIGRAIEQLYVERLEEFYEILAYHYSKSEHFEKAIEYLMQSGQKACSNHSQWEAFGFYKTAINILRCLPETEENKKRVIEVQLAMSGPMMALIFPEDSIDILEEGEKLAEELGDEKSLARIYFLIGYYHYHKGNPMTALKYNQNSFNEASKAEDIELMAPLALGLSNTYVMLGDYIKLSEVASTVIHLLEKTKRESDFFGIQVNIHSVLHAFYAHGQVYLGNTEKGLELIKKALDLSGRMNDLFGLALIELDYGIILIMKGEAQESIEHLEKSIALSELGGFDIFLGYIHANLGLAHYYLGNLSTSKEHIEMGIKQQTEAGRQSYLSFSYICLSLLLYDSGEHEKALDAAREALSLATNNQEKSMQAMSMMALGRILGGRYPPQYDKADEYIKAGIKTAEDIEGKAFAALGYYCLGELFWKSGRLDEAREILDTALRMFSDMGTIGFWPEKTREVLEGL